MGMDAVLTVIPSADYQKYLQGGRRGRRFELFREWYELDIAFAQMGKPVHLAIRGNRPSCEFSEDGFYHGVATSGLVKRIDKALGKLSEDELIAAIKEVRRNEGRSLRKYEYKYFVAVLGTLRAAYRSAARKEGCLEILIC